MATLNIPNLQPGKTYSVMVRSVNSEGDKSDYSVALQFMVPRSMLVSDYFEQRYIKDTAPRLLYSYVDTAYAGTFDPEIPVTAASYNGAVFTGRGISESWTDKVQYISYNNGFYENTSGTGRSVVMNPNGFYVVNFDNNDVEFIADTNTSLPLIFKGNIYSSSGTVGPWMFNSSSFVQYSGGGYTGGMRPDDYPFFAGAVGNAITLGKFYVTGDGTLHAKDVVINGGSLTNVYVSGSVSGGSGSADLTGYLTASAASLTYAPLINPTFTGSVVSGSFFGDGSGLTGIGSGVSQAYVDSASLVAYSSAISVASSLAITASNAAYTSASSYANSASLTAYTTASAWVASQGYLTGSGGTISPGSLSASTITIGRTTISLGGSVTSLTTLDTITASGRITGSAIQTGIINATGIIVTSADQIYFNNAVLKRSGQENLSAGFDTMNNPSSGLSLWNTAFGNRNLSSLGTGDYNTAVGAYTLTSVSNGSGNTAVGYQAGLGGDIEYNTFMGHSAGRFQNANNNVAIGAIALTGTQNLVNNAASSTAIGTYALSNTRAGKYNTSLGYWSGSAIIAGSANIFIGGNDGSTFNSGSPTNMIVISDGVGNIVLTASGTSGKVSIPGSASIVGATRMAGSASISGSAYHFGTTYSGTGTYAKNVNAGDIALDNSSTDTPGILFYYGNNSNWGIDSYSDGVTQKIRFVTNLNESGGTERAYVDAVGNFVAGGSVTATNIGDTNWTNVSSFSNSFVSGGTAPAYRKINNVVYLRGNVQSGTANTTAFTLPTGYRPGVTTVIPVQQFGTGNIDYITINTDGTVVPNATSAWLSSVVFPADN